MHQPYTSLWLLSFILATAGHEPLHVSCFLVYMVDQWQIFLVLYISFDFVLIFLFDYTNPLEYNAFVAIALKPVRHSAHFIAAMTSRSRRFSCSTTVTIFREAIHSCKY